jgi:hypothetical protein
VVFSLFFVFLFSHVPVSANSSPPALEWATSPIWLKLLHYQVTTFDVYESEIDSKNFFLNPESGKTSPELELKAALDILPNSLEKRCTFPARTLALAEKFPEAFEKVFHSANREKELRAQCGETFKWIDHLEAKSVSLVFSTSFLGNPASLFGHTFLVLNRNELNSTHTMATDLRSYAINFSADVPESDPGPIYLFKGVFGLYHGLFNVRPYYQMIGEYNNQENRDLWEYPISFNPQEFNRFLMHLFELHGLDDSNKPYADYFFFNENCSYQILTLLEAANPSLDLTSPFHNLAIPTQTLRRVIQEQTTHNGPFLKPIFRPSLSKKFLSEYSLLKPQEKAQFELSIDIHSTSWNTVNSVNPVTTGTDLKSTRTLDASIDYMNFIKFRDATAFSNEYESRLNTLLTERSQAAPATENSPIQNSKNAPHLGHGIHTLEVGWVIDEYSGPRLESEKSVPHLLLGGRVGFHEFLDRSEGFEPDLQLFGIRPQITYDTRRKKLKLYRFDFLEFQSRPAWNRLKSPLSLDFESSLKRFTDLNCESHDLNSCSLGLNLGGGAGVSQRLWHITLSELMHLELATASEMQKKGRMLLGPRLEALADAFNIFKLRTVWQLQYDPFESLKGRKLFIESSTALRFSPLYSDSVDFEVGANFSNIKTEHWPMHWAAKWLHSF